MTFLQISQILYAMGMFVWIFPAIRQYRTNFFYYFLILAILDPLNMLTYRVLGVNPFDTTSVFMSFLLIMAVLEKRVIKKYFLVFIAPIMVMIISSLTSDIITTNTSRFLLITIHSLIFSLILKLYAFTQSNKGTICWFYIIVIFYELTVILKFAGLTFGTENATAYFLLTTFVQIAFGLFFSIFREDDARLVTKL